LQTEREKREKRESTWQEEEEEEEAEEEMRGNEFLFGHEIGHETEIGTRERSLDMRRNS